MTIPTHFDLVFMQTLGGACEAIATNVPASLALITLRDAQRDDHGAGGVVYLRASNDVLGAAQAALTRLEKDGAEPLALIGAAAESLAVANDDAALRTALVELAALYLYQADHLEE